MAATIVTIEDLLSFKQDLIHEVRLILQDSLKQADEKKKRRKMKNPG